MVGEPAVMARIVSAGITSGLPVIRPECGQNLPAEVISAKLFSQCSKHFDNSRRINVETLTLGIYNK
jgi:hypothetical protein